VKYEITGPDHETGCERTVAVEADDEDAALKIAKQYGVFACKVKVIVPDRPPQLVAAPPQTQQLQLRSSAERKQVVRQFGAVFLLVLLCIPLFIVLVNGSSSSKSIQYSGTPSSSSHKGSIPKPYPEPSPGPYPGRPYIGSAKEDNQVLKIMGDLKNNDQARAREDTDTLLDAWKKGK